MSQNIRKILNNDQNVNLITDNHGNYSNGKRESFYLTHSECPNLTIKCNFLSFDRIQCDVNKIEEKVDSFYLVLKV